MSFTVLSGITPFVVAFAVIAALGVILAAVVIALLVRDRRTVERSELGSAEHKRGERSELDASPERTPRLSERLA